MASNELRDSFDTNKSLASENSCKQSLLDECFAAVKDSLNDRRGFSTGSSNSNEINKEPKKGLADPDSEKDMQPDGKGKYPEKEGEQGKNSEPKDKKDKTPQEKQKQGSSQDAPSDPLDPDNIMSGWRDPEFDALANKEQKNSKLRSDKSKQLEGLKNSGELKKQIETLAAGLTLQQVAGKLEGDQNSRIEDLTGAMQTRKAMEEIGVPSKQWRENQAEDSPVQTLQKEEKERAALERQRLEESIRQMEAKNYLPRLEIGR